MEERAGVVLPAHLLRPVAVSRRGTYRRLLPLEKPFSIFIEILTSRRILSLRVFRRWDQTRISEVCQTHQIFALLARVSGLRTLPGYRQTPRRLCRSVRGCLPPLPFYCTLSLRACLMICYCCSLFWELLQ